MGPNMGLICFLFQKEKYAQVVGHQPSKQALSSNLITAKKKKKKKEKRKKSIYGTSSHLPFL
jgi:hypothetical protein